MTSTLDYIARKFGLDITRKPPIEIQEINRVIMARVLSELGYTVGAEIGVAEGYHAEILCQNIPGLKLYGIDPWEHWPGYVDYGQERLDQFRRRAYERLAPYNVEFVEKLSLDAAKDFENGSLDFIYVDGAHDLLHVVQDLVVWWPKLKMDAVCFGHDWKRSTNPRLKQHVKDAVGAFVYAYELNPLLILGQRGHNDGIYREGTQSWLLVKQKEL